MRAVLPPPFRRAQKTAAQGSPPREAASVPAVCSARRYPCPCVERAGDSMVTLLAYGSPPHMRGMPARTAFFCSSIGSPPRMRGKSTLPPDGCLSLRSTPAHAGNCSVLRNPGRNAAPRITPARAGKRRPSHVYSQPFWDHPCLCREKICYEAPEDEKNGSPPRVRGKTVHKGLYRPALRITPACAGKSSIVPSSVLRRRDHPRLCGEKGLSRCA